MGYVTGSRIIVLVCALAAFARLFSAEFTWYDDPTTVHQNPSFNPPGLAKVAPYWTHVGAQGALGIYIPMTYTVWGALAQFAWLDQPDPSHIQLNPWIFHVANVVFHALAAVMVFEILRLLIPANTTFPAVAGALLFALHPVQVETVGWVSGLKDVLCGLLSFVAVRHYILFARSAEGSPRRRVHYLVATIAVVLAMLSKPTAMVTPLIVLAIASLILRLPRRQMISSLAPWFVLSLLCMIGARLAQPATQVDAGPLWVRPLLMADALTFYFWKLIYPLGLIVDYGRSPRHVIETGWLYFTWLAPAIVLGAAWAGRRRQPMLFTAAAVFVTGLLPVLGHTPFLFQQMSTVADHYLYLPMLGVAIMMAYGLSLFPMPAIRVAAVALLVALACTTVRQTGFWQNEVALWSHNAAINPRSAMAQLNLGGAMERQHDLVAAERHYIEAIRLDPKNDAPYDNLGHLYRRTGRLTEALDQFRAAARLNPGLIPELESTQQMLQAAPRH